MDIRTVPDSIQGPSLMHAGAVASPHANVTAPVAGASGAAPPPSPDDVVQALGHINRAIQSVAPGIEFSFDSDVNTTIVKVIDKNTNEVLRQLPSAETIEIAKALDKLHGLLIRQQA